MTRNPKSVGIFDIVGFIENQLARIPEVPKPSDSGQDDDWQNAKPVTHRSKPLNYAHIPMLFVKIESDHSRGNPNRQSL